MKSIVIIFIMVVIIAGLGYGVYYFNFLNNNNAEPDEDETIVDISEDEISDNSESADVINTKKGESFSVVLDANPTTGYQWNVDFDSEYLQLTDRDFVTQSEGLMVGAGGQETFNFIALESGETEINFSYLRSWEQGVEPIQKKTYNVIIE